LSLIWISMLAATIYIQSLC